jgi:hypothetical protein
MLLDDVTINDGGDCPSGFCAAAICVDNSIAGMPSKAIEVGRHLAICTACGHLLLKAISLDGTRGQVHARDAHVRLGASGDMGGDEN